MNLARFPRRRYTLGPTPIEELSRLSLELGGPTLFMKRDDMLGLAGGGNKTRKLEFLVADALAQGADTLITCGAVQSNHCRLTLAAAVKEGLNVVPGGSDMPAEMQKAADMLAAEGRKGYIIPGGGSNPLGATGYVACAQEIIAQAFEMGLAFDHVVCASGSAGTHAGLVTGFQATNSGIPVIGINVSRKKAEQEDIVFDLANRTAAHLGVKAKIDREAVVCFDQYVGPGYSLPTAEMAEAVRLLARLECILMDPVYTGKAMAGLIDLVRRGHFSPEEKVLFVHTGGSPALYAYMADILD